MAGLIALNEFQQGAGKTEFPLPVEVIPMAAPLVGDSLQKLGFTPSIRVSQDGTRYITDEGNLILDCHGLLMENPEEIVAKIDSIVGVVEYGLFLKMADRSGRWPAWGNRAFELGRRVFADIFEYFVSSCASTCLHKRWRTHFTGKPILDLYPIEVAMTVSAKR